MYSILYFVRLQEFHNGEEKSRKGVGWMPDSITLGTYAREHHSNLRVHDSTEAGESRGSYKLLMWEGKDWWQKAWLLSSGRTFS